MKILRQLFHRNLVVTDTDLVVDSSVQPGEASLNLNGQQNLL